MKIVKKNANIFAHDSLNNMIVESVFNTPFQNRLKNFQREFLTGKYTTKCFKYVLILIVFSRSTSVVLDRSLVPSTLSKNGKKATHECKALLTGLSKVFDCIPHALMQN